MTNDTPLTSTAEAVARQVIGPKSGRVWEDRMVPTGNRKNLLEAEAGPGSDIDLAVTEPTRKRRDDRGETLAFLVMWPVLIVAILLLLVHTFIVVNAQAEAEVAASEGLRAAWRAAAATDMGTSEGTQAMANAAKDAAAEVAGQGDGWRWWTPGATEVKSDWCHPPGTPAHPLDPTDPKGKAGWVQVKVQGEVFGPMAALWPGRLDQVYAVANGPAVLTNAPGTLELEGGYVVPPEGHLTDC
ncbi:hypothetical protein [Candidatus Poriferisocius sp.]|uniref:hypothetical protein n=1 Tax=Candidatus Poriferisocius sp. TaxID=3101276 RepID=UPI003B022FF2